MNYRTEQENFWAGEFGVDYSNRNNCEELLFSKVAMWSRMLRCANNVKSIVEFGCNIGLNLLAISKINKKIDLSGYEINEFAANEARKLNVANIFNQTIVNNISAAPVDLTFTSGVLIHINPDCLDQVYENLVKNSNRFVLIAEYYSREPMSSIYRGNNDRLFKRDFAGDIIDKYGLSLIDYGFIYHRDNCSPQDDVNWFLLEK